MSAQPLDSLGGHSVPDTQARVAAEVTNSLPGHPDVGAQSGHAGQGSNSAAAMHLPSPIDGAPLRLIPLADQASIDAHLKCVGEVKPPARQSQPDAHAVGAGGSPSPRRATDTSVSIAVVRDEATSPDRATLRAEPTDGSPGRDQAPAGGASAHSPSMGAAPRLLDPTLALAADVLDDLERVRIANENRLRQLTRVGVDKDGGERGFGLDEGHPDVARLGAIVALLAQAEHDATLQLQRAMRRHALGPWVKSTVGLGEKQAARLLAAVGDPYWNDLHERPRTVSELWAFCGYRPGQRRKRGEKSNWSADAKMRAYLCAESCMKQARSPYRPLYDARRAATVERTHEEPCVRCGPKGKPADVGSPWSKAHQHADAVRVVAKAILRDLWRAARDLHTTPA